MLIQTQDDSVLSLPIRICLTVPDARWEQWAWTNHLPWNPPPSGCYLHQQSPHAHIWKTWTCSVKLWSLGTTPSSWSPAWSLARFLCRPEEQISLFHFNKHKWSNDNIYTLRQIKFKVKNFKILSNASFTHLPLDPAPRSLKKAVLDLSERPPKLL